MPDESYLEVKLIMICNACGREIIIKNNLLNEDVFEAVKEWGFFSKKDLEIHKFNLCEKCYNRITGEFAVPVSVQYKNEVLDYGIIYQNQDVIK